jgi:3-dehydroquinate synthase
MATPDSQTIEAVMSTNITTTIKIARGLLHPSNKILAEVYKPLGRCIAVIDDKVEKLFGADLQAYFEANGIPLTKLIHAGNEINKDIKNVEAILIDMKNNGVARNEPVLIVGGGVIADIGGFATALYHRNTPYIMLCTSIVTGIDAGPSPRTCCDGHGFKNLYGAYHPPVLTLTDRYFWKTLHEGWIRHGIAEIIKMACVKDFPLFELIEKAGTRLIMTKFGTEGCEDDQEFQDLCDEIVGKAMESYVRSEYGNLWETHQCRPHAFGHTWSPGYELPAGMLHGHAVASCMGYGAFLSYKRNWLSQEKFDRILKLISDMELTLWHPIMDNHDLVKSANKKAHQKRGGNLCAPVPKDEIGKCGYINDHSNDDVTPTMNEYKALVAKMPRGGAGIDMHCHDVGLEDPSTVATDALAQIGQAPCSAHIELKEVPNTYDEWLKAEQVRRNADWEKNVSDKVAPDTEKPAKFDQFTLFQEGAEAYALSQTTVSSENIQNASNITEQ